MPRDVARFESVTEHFALSQLKRRRRFGKKTFQGHRVAQPHRLPFGTKPHASSCVTVRLMNSSIPFNSNGQETSLGFTAEWSYYGLEC